MNKRQRKKLFKKFFIKARAEWWTLKAAHLEELTRATALFGTTAMSLRGLKDGLVAYCPVDPAALFKANSKDDLQTSTPSGPVRQTP